MDRPLIVARDYHTLLVGVLDEPTIGIDTPEDYRAFVARCEECKS